MLCAKYQKAGQHGSWEKGDRNFSILRIYTNYSKFRQTGSWQAAELSYMIEFSILMLCAKYQEAGLHGSWEKCDKLFCDADYTARRQIVIPRCRANAVIQKLTKSVN